MGRQFVLAATGEEIVLSGPNVIVKGPPYVPSVDGDDACHEIIDDACTLHGNCTSCTTFTAADIEHIQAQGMNAIRLGVIWAGAQPRDEDALDAGFLQRLHALLSLCDHYGLHVLLDNHGDMVGAAGCGNGVPMWIQRRAAGELIGKPLRSQFPYFLFSCSLQVSAINGYARCGANEDEWAAHAGDERYAILNECCTSLNYYNPAGLGFKTISQRTLDYVLGVRGRGEADGELTPAGYRSGRAAFVRFWRLMAQAVADHPSAVGCELMNEPLSFRRQAMFETWREAAEAIHAVIPDMAVGLADFGTGPGPLALPAWTLRAAGVGWGLSSEIRQWIHGADYLFYAWHEHGSAAANLASVSVVSEQWRVPLFGTELYSCEAWNASSLSGVSRAYWLYASYCDTAAEFTASRVARGNDTFGACVLGWGGQYPSKRASTFDPCSRVPEPRRQRLALQQKLIRALLDPGCTLRPAAIPLAALTTLLLLCPATRRALLRPGVLRQRALPRMPARPWPRAARDYTTI